MDKEEILELTKELYRISLLFPKKEPLRYKIREIGDELLADIVSLEKGRPLSKNLFSKAEGEFEIIKSFLAIAIDQNWVKKEEISKLSQGYEKLAGELFEAWSKFQKELEKERPKEIAKKEEIEREGEFQPQVAPLLISQGLEEFLSQLEKRQREVFKILQEEKEISIGELSKKFPQVSKRTLLRDLEKLSQKGYVVREGEGRGAHYRFQLPKKS